MRAIWGVVLVLGLAVGPALGAAQPDGYDCPVDTEDVEEPGAELANVVGAQETVVARELERRGFNATLANASSPEERATVVATELDRIEARLTALETCQEALIEARESDDLTAREYRQRAGSLDPDVEDVNERLDRAEVAASDLSPEVRQESDIDRERFADMGERVADLQAFVAQPSRSIDAADEEAESDPPAVTATDPPAERSPPPETTTEEETEDEGTPEEPDTETPESTETEAPDDGDEGEGNDGDGNDGENGGDGDENGSDGGPDKVPGDGAPS